MNIGGQTVLLTGATGGIGRSIATTLAGRGANLIVSGRKLDALEELVAGLPGNGHRAIAAELGRDGGAEELAEQAGDVDILVANAALPGTGLIDTYDAEDLKRALRVNLESPMLLSRALYPGMTERGSGHIVFIASLAGKSATPRSSIYNATKFGLRGFSMALRADLAPTGVGVSLVTPGFIRDAGMFAGQEAPPGVGTASPQDVADGVVRAIERNKVEVVVAEMRLRVISHMSQLSPSISARVVSGKAALKSASDLADHQADMR